MAKWKVAFLKSVDLEYQSEDSFTFGQPATLAELSVLEATINARIPDVMREMLREFNGIKTADGVPYFFDTTQMTTAAEYYRQWDWPTDLLIECSANILYVCQENGFSEMWGAVFRPFGPFKYGQIVAFDHDRIRSSKNPEELFIVPYDSLLELVEAEWKKSAR